VAPPPTKKNFLDFGAIEEEKPNDVKDSLVQEATAVSETGLCTLQAADFGFAVDDDASSAASSSAPSSPASAVPTLGKFGGAASEANAKETPSSARVDKTIAAGSADSSSASAAAETKIDSASGYQDRHKDLSLQERLANLEFSDDPLGLKARGS